MFSAFGVIELRAPMPIVQQNGVQNETEFTYDKD